MYQSILHFIEKDIIEIEKIMGQLLKGEKVADDLSKEEADRSLTLANRLICELYEEIRNSISRKLNGTSNRGMKKKNCWTL